MGACAFSTIKDDYSIQKLWTDNISFWIDIESFSYLQEHKKGTLFWVRCRHLEVPVNKAIYFNVKPCTILSVWQLTLSLSLASLKAVWASVFSNESCG